jgi:iduronate 2-sulfatase
MPRFLVCLPIVCAALSGAGHPNILLICVDDLKPVLGCYGDTVVKSPNIDALARRGVRFERAYCNQAVCAPSRNALMTGLRPQTIGVYDLGTNFRKAVPDAVTLAQHFKAHGYRTGAMGKIFHVGHGNHEDPASWSVPHVQANSIAYALPSSRAKDGLTREEALFQNKPAGRLPRGASHEAADVTDDAYPDAAIADEAIRRLGIAKEKPGEPFFLAVGFLKPHLPFCAPKKYWDLYERRAFKLPAWTVPPDDAPPYAPQFGGELRQYAGIPERGALDDELQRTLIHGYHAAISFVDAQLGRVIAALDETGLAANTIVVLWGDHGWHLGDHGMWCKHTNYEQAARIPLVIAADTAPAGRTSGALIESVDLYPTLCELAGIRAPAGIDGTSFATVVRDPAREHRDHITHVYPRGERLGRAIRTARHRLVEWKRPGAPADTAEFELYDYDDDPEETVNRAAGEPEVVAHLRRLLGRQAEAKPQWRPAPAPAEPKSATRSRGGL